MLVILCNATLQCNMLFCAILSAICCVKSFSMLFVFLLLALACTNNVSNTKPKNSVHKLTIKYSISCHIVSYRIVSYRIVSYRTVSYCIVPYRTVSCNVTESEQNFLQPTNQQTQTSQWKDCFLTVERRCFTLYSAATFNNACDWYKNEHLCSESNKKKEWHYTHRLVQWLRDSFCGPKWVWALTSIFIWAVVLKWALLLSCVHWVSSRSLAPLPVIAHRDSICPLWSNSEFTPSDLAKHFFLWFTAVWFLFQLYISALDTQEHVTWTLLQRLMYLTYLILVIFRHDGNKCLGFLFLCWCESFSSDSLCCLFLM